MKKTRLSQRKSLGGKKSFRTGQTVQWKFGTNVASGKIVKIHRSRVEIEQSGSTIKMNGSKDRPVYEIVQESGVRLLKTAKQLM